jgi:hypothetical protein
MKTKLLAIAFLFLTAVTAGAEIRRAEMTVFGMD